MSADVFLAAWNLIYIVPFLLAILYLGVYSASGLTFGEAGVEGDFHADVEGDFHADVDADLHGDFHADAHLEADAGDLHVDAGDLHADAGDLHPEAEGDLHADAEADGHGHASGESMPSHDAPFYIQALSWLGLGRVPLSILLMVLFISWGAIGFCVNFMVAPLLPDAWMSLLISLPIAAVGSTNLTRGVMLVMSRWMPTTETYSHRRAELVGTTGEALFAIDRKFGLVTVRDRHGDLFQVGCRVYGDSAPIEKGTKVLLVDYDPEKELFYVKEYDLELIPEPKPL